MIRHYFIDPESGDILLIGRTTLHEKGARTVALRASKYSCWEPHYRGRAIGNIEDTGDGIILTFRKPNFKVSLNYGEVANLKTLLSMCEVGGYNELSIPLNGPPTFKRGDNK